MSSIAHSPRSVGSVGSVSPTPVPARNPLKLKKAAKELFAEHFEGPVCDLSYLQIPIAKVLALKAKELKMPTGDKEQYIGEDGSEKTRNVTVSTPVVQLTLNLEDFFSAVVDAQVDYRVTEADIPHGGIASRIMSPDAFAKAEKRAKAASTPKSKKAKVPGAPKKAKKASPKAEDAPKAPAMPVLTDEQLQTLLDVRPLLARKAQIKTLKKHFVAMGVEEDDFEQARKDWIAYRAENEPRELPALLDEAKLEELSTLGIGPTPQVRNPTLIEKFDEWEVAESDRKRATVEYKAWAKEHGIEKSPKASASSSSSKKAPKKASKKAPKAIRTPAAAEESEDEESEDERSPAAEEDLEHDSALEAVGAAEDHDDNPFA